MSIALTPAKIMALALSAAIPASYAAVVPEQKTLDQLYQSALKEGGEVIVYAEAIRLGSRMVSSRRLKNAFRA